MRTAWMDGVYDAEILHELNTAVEEVAALLRCRKALCDEGLKALLELLNSMKTHHVCALFLCFFLLCKFVMWYNIHYNPPIAIRFSLQRIFSNIQPSFFLCTVGICVPGQCPGRPQHRIFRPVHPHRGPSPPRRAGSQVPREAATQAQQAQGDIEGPLHTPRPRGQLHTCTGIFPAAQHRARNQDGNQRCTRYQYEIMTFLRCFYSRCCW